MIGLSAIRPQIFAVTERGERYKHGPRSVFARFNLAARRSALQPNDPKTRLYHREISDLPALLS
jgi:hypothetical protein